MGKPICHKYGTFLKITSESYSLLQDTVYEMRCERGSKSMSSNGGKDIIDNGIFMLHDVPLFIEHAKPMSALIHKTR